MRSKPSVQLGLRQTAQKRHKAIEVMHASMAGPEGVRRMLVALVGNQPSDQCVCIWFILHGVFGILYVKLTEATPP